MDKLMDTWRASRQKLKDELASIEAKANGKKGLTIGEADEHTELDNAVTRKLIGSLQSRIAQLDVLIGAKRDSRDA